MSPVDGAWWCSSDFVELRPDGRDERVEFVLAGGALGRKSADEFFMGLGYGVDVARGMGAIAPVELDPLGFVNVALIGGRIVGAAYTSPLVDTVAEYAANGRFDIAQALIECARGLNQIAVGPQYRRRGIGAAGSGPRW